MQDRLRDRRNLGFFQIENAIVDSEEFTMAEKMAYMVLVRYAGNGNVAFPSVATIAKKMGCGETTARKAIKGLEDKGVIKKEIRKKSNGGNQSNLYEIIGVVNKEEQKQEKNIKEEIEKKVEEFKEEYKRNEEEKIRREIKEEFEKNIEETIKILENEKNVEKEKIKREQKVFNTILERKEMLKNGNIKDVSDRFTSNFKKGRLEKNRK